MSPRQSNPDRTTWVLQGEKAVSEASAAARGFAEARSLAGDDRARLCVIVEELVSNLYDHGGLGTDDRIELGLASEPDAIRITLVDPAAPFNPWEAATLVERPERGGGAGLDIVRAWTRFVGYGRTPEGNRLELILPFNPGA